MDADRSLKLLLLHLLDRGEGGALDDEAVWWAAEELEEQFGSHYPAPRTSRSEELVPDDSQPLARSFLVLDLLVTLPHQLITRDDIPAMRELLEGEDQPRALVEWDAYYTGIDWESRRASLAEHPLYGPFTKLL